MTTETEITSALDAMAEIDQELLRIAAEKQKMIDSVLTDEIKEQLSSIEAEFMGIESSAHNRRQNLEFLVREGVVSLGKSVAGNFLLAVFTKGRYSWDKKEFDKLVKKYPEIESIRSQGDPYVSIKKVSQGEPQC